MRQLTHCAQRGLSINVNHNGMQAALRAVCISASVILAGTWGGSLVQPMKLPPPSHPTAYTSTEDTRGLMGQKHASSLAVIKLWS